MTLSTVAIVRYEKPRESVEKAVALSQGLENLKPGMRVFIKPNIVFWTKSVAFPKWGVITTSRVVEDMVRLLKDRGVDDITIGEGTVTQDPRDTETPAHAHETLGYKTLEKRYGIKAINVFERPFEKVDLGDGITLNFNTDILHSDLVVDLPAMKAHNQTMVSLGIKNLKGTIDIPSRKKCHNADPEKNLDFMVARLADKLPPMFTLIDGIYTLERGPGPDGSMRKSDILVASGDVLSADMVGARLLGYEPKDVPHLAMAAANHGRPTDLSDVTVVGESIEELASRHNYDFTYASDETGEFAHGAGQTGHQGGLLPQVRRHHVHLLQPVERTDAHRHSVCLEGRIRGPSGSAHRKAHAADAGYGKNPFAGQVHVPEAQEQSRHQRNDRRQGMPAQTGGHRQGPAPGRHRGRSRPVRKHGPVARIFYGAIQGPAGIRGEIFQGGIGRKECMGPGFDLLFKGGNTIKNSSVTWPDSMSMDENHLPARHRIPGH